MFKSFDRYVLKEIWSPFAVGLTVYTFTLLINHVLKLSKLLITKGTSAGIVFKILLFLMPDLLSFTVPMASLMGILAGLSRMSSDSEVVAFRTMGISNAKILKPVMLFSSAAWLLSSWLIMYLAPEANFRLSRLLNEVVLSQNMADIKPRVFYQDLPYYCLYFRDTNKQNDWEDVLLYSQESPEEDTLVLAKSGKFVQNQQQKEGHIVLFNGVIHSFKKNEPENYSLTMFTQKTEKISNMFTIKQTRRSTQLIFPQLIRKMKENRDDISLALEFHNKFALPFACLALGLLGLSLGISTKKGGKTNGLTISLGIIFIYYVMITASRNMILKRIISPFSGMWLPNIFLLLIGFFLYRYSSQEKEINWEKIFTIIDLRRRKKETWDLKPRREKRCFPLARRVVKILDVYVLKKMALLFFLIFSSLLLIFYIITIIDLMDEIIENKIPFIFNLKYNFYLTPEIVTIVLPVSVLTAVLLTYSLMSKNNEVVAVQVSGISLYRLALPSLAMGLLLSLGAFWIQEDILPEANKKAILMLDIIHNRKPVIDMELSKNWVSGKNDEIYFYNFLEKERNRFVNFNILYLNPDFSLSKRISARYAYWTGPHTLELSNGFEREFADRVPVRFIRFPNRRMEIAEDRSYFTQVIKFSVQMGIRELKRYIRFLKSSNSETARFEAQLYYNYAFPFSSLVMVLIAIPFSFLMGNKGTLYGIGVAIGISMAYWGILGVFSSLGSTAILSPALSAFAPLVIFVTISTILLLNIKT